MTHVKIKGNRAHVRMRLPRAHYEGITQLTEGLVLAVLITEEIESNVPGPPAWVTNPNSGSRSLQEDSISDLKEFGKLTSPPSLLVHRHCCIFF